MEQYLHNVHDDAPCVVVGSSLTALRWAVTLQRRIFTLLLTTGEFAVDPYLPAAEAAGFPVDDLMLRPKDVMKRGTVLYGRLVHHGDREIQVALRDGTSLWLPIRVLLHGDSPELLVNGTPWNGGDENENGGSRVRLNVEEIGSQRVVLAGHPGTAASTAVELLTRRYPPEVSWIQDPESEVSSRWTHVVTVLGGEVIYKGTTENQPVMAMARHMDAFGREEERERSFVLPDHRISRPNGGLYENVSTCAFSTETFPLSLHRLRKSTVNPEIPTILSKRAKVSLIKRGIARLALSAPSLERRVEAIGATITAIRNGE